MESKDNDSFNSFFTSDGSVAWLIENVVKEKTHLNASFKDFYLFDDSGTLTQKQPLMCFSNKELIIISKRELIWNKGLQHIFLKFALPKVIFQHHQEMATIFSQNSS